MDAAGEEQSLRLTRDRGPAHVCVPPVLRTYQPSSVPNHMELWWASGSRLRRSSRLPRVKEPRLERRRARPSVGLSPRRFWP